MTGPRKELRLADMRGKPMTAAWYQYLFGVRGTMRLLMSAHQRAARECKNRTRSAKEQDEVAQRLATASMEHLDLVLHTMEMSGGWQRVDESDE
ncbi:hypothetical protein [Luteimonas qiangzhengi]|uniref:hypothetical protein n=1 Tax=Luteimonas sp. MJ146 TaxID=3129240 RepID=UPI0031BAB4E9